MLLSAVSVLVVAQSSSEIPEGLMNNPVYLMVDIRISGTVVTYVIPATSYVHKRPTSLWYNNNL